MVKSQKVSDDSMLETEVLWSKLEGTERGCLERLTPYERIEGLIGFRAGVWARWLVVAACLMLCHFNSSFAGADATGVRLGCCNPQRDIFLQTVARQRSRTSPACIPWTVWRCESVLGHDES